MNLRSLFVILFFSFQYAALAFCGEKILLLGDSHSVGTYGSALSERLRNDPSNVVQLYGVSGSVPKSWETDWISPYGMRFIYSDGKIETLKDNSTPKLSKLIDQFHPERIVVSLGTNFLWSDESEEVWKETIRTMIQTIKNSNAKCAWVGPPKLLQPLPDQPKTIEDRAKKLIRIRDIIQATVTGSGCDFIDGFELATYPDSAGGDGIHFDLAGAEGVQLAKKWADGVFHAIKRLQKSSSKQSCD